MFDLHTQENCTDDNLPRGLINATPMALLLWAFIAGALMWVL